MNKLGLNMLEFFIKGFLLNFLMVFGAFYGGYN